MFSCFTKDKGCISNSAIHKGPHRPCQLGSLRLDIPNINDSAIGPAHIRILSYGMIEGMNKRKGTKLVDRRLYKAKAGFDRQSGLRYFYKFACKVPQNRTE